MIRINDDYSVTSDKYQWVLINHVPFTNKKNERKIRDVNTYHRTLEQVAKYVSEQSIKPCESFEDMMNEYRATGQMIANLLSGKRKEDV